MITIANGSTFDVSAHSGAYHLVSGQTLQGTGTVVGGMIVDSDAHVAPGNSPGTLYTDDVTFLPGSFFDVEITDAGHDVLDVTGTVDLGGATLTLTLHTYPAVGDGYLIINNDGTDAVIGTFDGLDEGTLVVSSYEGLEREFRISYMGGTGNDVVLNAVPEPSTLAMLVGLGIAGLAALRRRRRTP